MADIEVGRVPSSRVFDPFPGDGAIALEALRLGCETYANDYNPVAVLILKATLESPQKYGRPFEGMAAGLLAQEEVAAQDDGPRWAWRPRLPPVLCLAISTPCWPQ